MTDFPDGIVIEARKAGLKQAKRKAADGSWFDVHDITFEIHPNDTNSPLSNMPLGTRVALVVTQLREDGSVDTPAVDSAETPPVKGGERARRAGILCGTMPFQNWLYDAFPDEWQMADQTCSGDEADATAQAVRNLCRVKSRAELDHDEEAGRFWDQLTRKYYDAQRGITEPDLERMRDGR